MRIDRRIAELVGIPLRWTSRLPEARAWVCQILHARHAPGAGRTLWLGFGVLILLLVALGTVFSTRLGTLSTHFRTQTEISRPRVAAARELEILLLSFTANVRGFLNGYAGGQQLAEANAGEMAVYLAEYERLAETPEQCQLAADFSSQWSALRAHAETLLSTDQASTEDLKNMTAMRIVLRKLLDDKIQPDALAFQESQTIATLSSLEWSLKFNLLLLSGAVVIALVTGAAVARTVLNSEEGLRKSEAFLSEVLNSSFAGVYVYDLQRRAHVFINRQYTVLTGHILDCFSSMTGEEFFALFHPEDAPRVAGHIEQVARAADGEVLEVEYRFRTADGRWIWALSRDSVFTRKADGSAQRLIGSVLDITGRKLAEAALHESDERFRQFMSNSPTIAWIKDEEGRYFYISRTYEERFGTRATDWLGKTDAEMWPAETAETFRSHDRAALDADHAIEVEEETINADGSRCSWLISKFPFRDAGGSRFVGGIGLDITERKAAEAALQKSELKHRLLFETSHDAIMTVAPPDWRFTSGNPATVAMFRTGQEAAFVATVPWQLSPEFQPDGWRSEEKGREEIATAMREGSHFFEWQHQRLDGEVFPATVLLTRFDLEGQSMLQATVRDITERAEAEAALRERERELNRVLETAATGLARLTRDLRYVFANHPYARMIGVPVEQIVGRSMVEVIGKAALEAIRPCIDQVLRGERTECEIEVPFAQGRKFLWVTGTPDVDSEGQIAGCFVSLVDLTEQKALESEVLQVSEAEQQRLATNLHDGICQDLTAISAIAKGLQRQLEKQSHPLAPDMGKVASSIAQATSQARQIAHGMNPVVVGGDGLMGALRELVSRTAENHPVSCSLKCSSPLLIFDPVVSTQLFLTTQEAVRNAVRHSGATQIDVELSETDFEFCLVIKDDGRGLPPDADKGSGLGLRGMRYRAGLINGRLVVQPCKSGGTEVICLVPKQQETGIARIHS